MKFERILSVFIIIMYLLAPVNAFEIFGHEIGWDDAGVASGAAAVALVAATVATGGLDLVAIGGAIAIGGLCDLIYRKVTGKYDTPTAVNTGAKTPTKDELINDTDVKNKLANLQAYSESEAAKDLFQLRQQLSSSLTTYDFKTEGALADIRITIKGPEKIYGFSPFPLQVHIHAPSSKEPPQNCVHITSVKAYVVDDSGRKWYEDVWTGDLVLRPKSWWYPDALGEDWDFNFTLKAPDKYVGKAKNIVQGTADYKTAEELLNANISKFEVVVEVQGYREVWRWESEYTTWRDLKERGYRIDGTHVYTAQGTPVGEFHETDPETGEGLFYTPEFVKNVELNVKASSLSAYNHLQNGKYFIGGTEGSLPARFGDVREFTAYGMYANGATSLIVARCWATPVHLFDSTADYKFVVIANRDNMKPINVSIIDDYKMVVFREFADGTWVIADQIPGSFGNMGDYISTVASTLTYKHDNNTVGYSTYFVVYAVLKPHNDCGNVNEIPIWIIVKPKISVLDNTEVVLGDKQTEEIASIIDDGKITESEAQSLKNIAESAISALKQKKYSAEHLVERYSSNPKAQEYAKKAVECYDKAIGYLEDMMASNDASTVARDYKVSKNYEMAGDYYYDAAQKEFYGQHDQAEADVNNAEKIIDDTKQYEPSMFFSLGSTLGEWWSQFKSGLGIDWIPDWAIILIVVILVVGGAIIVLKIL
ncbi:conserved hypothetical protein [Methanocaldococcus sp. FS406-22]|uniref:hypothetical protein n=1 Tax=Methanocaldococcus sp. (strain FS406-22) TaxID=644281 RepID=UPI0001BF34F5|nr:hypothetical protein [Methanocaldococcus sp. FS406-22]ADC69819.1 conserved hypothetical protein [Methanocaldococcus sp. FS406-22]